MRTRNIFAVVAIAVGLGWSGSALAVAQADAPAHAAPAIQPNGPLAARNQTWKPEAEPGLAATLGRKLLASFAAPRSHSILGTATYVEAPAWNLILISGL